MCVNDYGNVRFALFGVLGCVGVRPAGASEWCIGIGACFEAIPGPCRLRSGIARALLQSDPEARLPLRQAGFLSRDPRMKERKKYGQPGARKRFQFSKR